jgi:hypothetical protein
MTLRQWVIGSQRFKGRPGPNCPLTQRHIPQERNRHVASFFSPLAIVRNLHFYLDYKHTVIFIFLGHSCIDATGIADPVTCFMNNVI